MKLPYKMLTINFAIVVFLSIYFGVSMQTKEKEFGVAFGLAALLIGAANLFFGIISLLAKSNKAYTQGFFLSCGILLLTGFLSCTISFQMQ